MAKDFLKMLVLSAVMLAIGGMCGLMLRPNKAVKDKVRLKVETITVTDTITIEAPTEASTISLGKRNARLPLATESATEGDAAFVADAVEDMGRTQVDSAVVTIPITQKHYRDSSYEAWVSGYNQRLDSIRVFPTTTTVRIKEYAPSNQWHIGLTAGYGFGHGGFSPYIGIGITYSLFSF